MANIFKHFLKEKFFHIIWSLIIFLFINLLCLATMIMILFLFQDLQSAWDIRDDYRLTASISKDISNQEFDNFLNVLSEYNYDTTIPIGPKALDTDVVEEAFYYSSFSNLEDVYYFRENLGDLSLPIKYVSDRQYQYFSQNPPSRLEAMLSYQLFYTISLDQLKLIFHEEFPIRLQATKDLINNTVIYNLSSDQVTALSNIFNDFPPYFKVVINPVNRRGIDIYWLISLSIWPIILFMLIGFHFYLTSQLFKTSYVINIGIFHTNQPIFKTIFLMFMSLFIGLLTLMLFFLSHILKLIFLIDSQIIFIMLISILLNLFYMYVIYKKIVENGGSNGYV